MNVTIFRSTDAGEAEQVADLLFDAGLDAELAGDEQPGVPAGSVEVRVPRDQEARAEAVLAQGRSQPVEGDASSNLNLVAIFEGVGTTAELEAMSIRAVLDANEIPSIMIGTSELPNLPFAVSVPRDHEAAAREALQAAQQAGAEAADLEAAASEGVVT